MYFCRLICVRLFFVIQNRDDLYKPKNCYQITLIYLLMKKFLHNLECDLFRMKNNLRALVALVVMFGMNQVVTAQTSGIFESYAILSINGGTNTFYDMQATTANPDFQGANLGSFSNLNSLVIKGGQTKTFKNGSCNINGASIN